MENEQQQKEVKEDTPSQPIAEESVEQTDATTIDESKEQSAPATDVPLEEHEETAVIVEGEQEQHLETVDQSMEYIEYINAEDVTEGQETLVVIPSGKAARPVVVQTDDGREETVMMQEVTDENGQIYLVPASDDAIIEEDEEVSIEIVKPKDQEIKKLPTDEDLPAPIVHTIPSHILGRRIDNPSIDNFRNGKPPSKPRLGVKIPYRNLTSQIVSRQELTQEIVNRGKKLQENNGGAQLSTRRISAKLVKKLEGANAKKASMDNSDLIAILEGDDDNTPAAKAAAGKALTAEEERQIALQQLSELPDDTVEPPKKKMETRRSEYRRVTPLRKVAEDRPGVTKVADVLVVPGNSDDDSKSLKRKIEPEVELRPTKVIKTYSRTAKTVTLPANSNIVVESAETSKIDLPNAGYVTKSSRVIKKKVIWDPDDVTKKAKKLDTPTTPTSSSSSPSPKQKKYKSEIDKLLMDEGAVNMLYSLNDEEESRKSNRSLKTKATEVKKELQQQAEISPPKLRKKEDSAAPSTPTKPTTPTPKPVVAKTVAPTTTQTPKSVTTTPKATPAKEAATPATKTVKATIISSTPPKTATKSAKKVVSVPPAASKIIRRHSSSSFTSNDEESSSAPAYKYFTLDHSLHYTTVKLQQIVFDYDFLQEFMSIIKTLEQTTHCKAIVVTSSVEDCFTSGLDYSKLIAAKEAQRRALAKKYATTVKNFLIALLKCKKLLVAVVKGECQGLGVIMLNCFDIVFADESAKFNLRNARLQCAVEGGSLLPKNNCIPELIYFGSTLDAEQALKYNLITSIIKESDLSERLSALAKLSPNVVAGAKRTKPELDYDVEMLVEQWSSDECQKAFESVDVNV